LLVHSDTLYFYINTKVLWRLLTQFNSQQFHTCRLMEVTVRRYRLGTTAISNSTRLQVNTQIQYKAE
jgi:hypothetical protein